MRVPFLLCCLSLCSCEGPATIATVGVNVASVMLVGRAVPDIVVSGITGRDCSVVRLDRRLAYCAPPEAAPGPPPYCTRSIGRVDCWVTPPVAVPLPPSVAQGPQQLSPAQDADRVSRWPGL